MDEDGRRLGVLVIGAGWLGSRRAAAAVACAATRLAGVCSRRLPNRSESAGTLTLGNASRTT